MLFLLLISLVSADVYMHNPRGANDRNCERNVNRNNGNLLYDTQNNAKGGYACPRAVAANNANIPPKGMTKRMEFEVGSKLDVEWTSQHGCGVPIEPNSPGAALGEKAQTVPNVHCEMVIQMMCTSTLDPTGSLGVMHANTPQEYAATPREGIPNSNGDAATNRIGTADPGQAAGLSAGGGNGNLRFGVHETPAMYNECNRVQRNRGLFTADQNVNRRSAIGTRQNPNGGRRGLECPEERDYYPYWRPTGMIDVAYLVDDPARCGESAPNTPLSLAEAKVGCGGWTGVNKANSLTAPTAVANRACVGQAKQGDWVGNAQGWKDNWNYACMVTVNEVAAVPKTATGLGTAARRLYNRREWPVTEAACAPLVAETAGMQVTWAPQQFTAGFAANAQGQPNAANVVATAQLGPTCQTIDYSRSNHLGNSGVDDTATRFQMTIPPVIAGTAQARDSCVLRLRYNMTSSDYVRNLTSAANGNNSPIKQDPLVKIGAANTDYAQLALNTNQVGRTFQDRSYVFEVVPPTTTKTVQNMNVRGKRGNIVQVYPGVEYDFVPNKVAVDPNTVLDFQWLGSDYNPRRGCNDGEGGPYRGDNNVAAGLNAGTQGSNQNSRVDRMTLLAMGDSRKNYPGQMVSGNGQFFKNVAEARKFAFADAQAQLQDTTTPLVPQALNCLTNTEIDNINNENRRENHPRNCAEGNAISPYFSSTKIDLGNRGITGNQAWQLFSARNNNFSNRDSKVTVSYYPQGIPTSGNSGTVVSPPAITPLGPVTQIGLMDQFIKDNPAVYTDNSDLPDVVAAMESDIPGFDPVENDDYGEGAKEGCTQEMMMFGNNGFPSFSMTNLVVLFLSSVAYMLL